MAKRVIEDLRNVAIIAHVDHGKTTLVDAMLKQSGAFRTNEQVATRAMDNNDLERERGITILAKNTAIEYEGCRINIVDTPGHADFGGEVERILKMVEGVLLIVDAFDGPMPQTRFVLNKALELKLEVIVVVNKVDREMGRAAEVPDEILDLFISLGADEDQIDFPVIYASGRDGRASESLGDFEADLESMTIFPLLDKIISHVPAPEGDPDGALQLLVSNIESDPYVGRMAVGKVQRGCIRDGQPLAIVRLGEEGRRQGKVAKLYRYEALGKAEIHEASIGEIVCVAGVGDVNIGDTLTALDQPEALPFVHIDEPTISMTFSVNDSPFAGREGDYLTSRHLRERLFRETDRNVSLRVEESPSPDAFIVKGRGEMHLSILVETMRREGYEFQLSRPRVITKLDEAGQRLEPVEELTIEVPEEYVGTVIQKVGQRRGELLDMHPLRDEYTRLIFRIPSRGLIGYRTQFLTDTKGNGIMNSILAGYETWRGEIETRNHSVIVARETGTALTYGLYNAQERGTLFIDAGTEVYEGMIVGSNPKPEEVTVNVCKKKHVTNMRAAGSDEALRLVTPTRLSLEQCMEFVCDDELIEVTPKSIRLRKLILNTDMRAKQRSLTKDRSAS
ncbi:MAG: translational GTPase TypA [Eubacteriales bacterium]|nr:translational GTPase TypA [Eubacteriales bacterium]